MTMNAGVPQKAPIPELRNITHTGAELVWEDALNVMRNTTNSNSDGRILTEVYLANAESEDWKSLYVGYDVKYDARTLEPSSAYLIKVRFKNNHGYGEWSDISTLKTCYQPQTGLDIHKAIQKNSPSELKKIIDNRQANIEAQNALGFTPLMMCADQNRTELLEILIERGANLENETNSGKTALMLAAFRGNIECVELLLQAGADVNHADKSGLTALHLATDGEQPRVVKALGRAGASLTATDHELRWTPLLRCACLRNNGNVEVARELVRLGARVDDEDRDGKTILHNAILNGHHLLFQFLLEEGASLEIKSHDGYSALKLAQALDHYKIQRMIQEYLSKQKTNAAKGDVRQH